MNRYITALLVVLTATGIEAQAYQSAIKAVMGGEVAVEELCRQQAFQGKEAEILSVIRALKTVQERDDHQPAPWTARVVAEQGCAVCTVADKKVCPRREAWPLVEAAPSAAIQIRAPSV